MSLAAIIITAGQRDHLLGPILDRCAMFDEVVVVGVTELRVPRLVRVPGITHTTLDALMKRDVGAVATEAEILVYLSDDHCPAPDFLAVFNKHYRQGGWHALAPQRFCWRNSQRCMLNVGEGESYIGGHGIVVRRPAIRDVPWLTAPHSPFWDKLHTYQLRDRGWLIEYADNDLLIEDVSGETPWV